MIVLKCEQRSEAWYQNRLGRFTASTFSDVMSGISTAGYDNIIASVVGEIITGESEEGYSNAIMERGIELEPEAVQEYEAIFGVKTEEVGLCIPDENTPLNEWVGVSPDRIIGEGLLEVKCPLIKTHLKYIRMNQLPNEYKWQVQGQLMVTGAKWCDFMSYYPKMKPFIIRVYPDEKMHLELTNRLLESIGKVKEMLSIYNKYDHEG